MDVVFSDYRSGRTGGDRSDGCLTSNFMEVPFRVLLSHWSAALPAVGFGVIALADNSASGHDEIGW